MSYSNLKSIFTVKYIVYFLLASLTLYAFINDKWVFNNRPSTNTPEYLSLHGVKNGKKNTVSVDGNIYVIPAEIEINVFTYGDIIKGEAGVLQLFFEFPSVDDGENSSRARPHERVRVELRHFGFVKRNVRNMYSEHLHKVVQYPEIGLVEFQKEDTSGRPMTHFVYQTIEKLSNYPKAQRLTFTCHGKIMEGRHLCRTGAQFKNGIHIWLFIPSNLMQQWQVIYEHIYTQVQSFNRK